jgi:hypothetical protein
VEAKKMSAEFKMSQAKKATLAASTATPGAAWSRTNDHRHGAARIGKYGA